MHAPCAVFSAMHRSKYIGMIVMKHHMKKVIATALCSSSRFWHMSYLSLSWTCPWVSLFHMLGWPALQIACRECDHRGCLSITFIHAKAFALCRASCTSLCMHWMSNEPMSFAARKFSQRR